jgi:hypothetical protein
MRFLLVAVLLAAMPAAAAPPDNGSPMKSQFTSIELDSCTVLRRTAEETAWSCSGLPGYPVFIAQSGQQFRMSFGPKAEQQKAARQSLPPPSSLFKDKRQRITVEWRYLRRNGRDLPYATIVRYFTSRQSTHGQVLVVTRVSETEACRMALIDALANPSAIALARSAADERARIFDCRSEPSVLGATGKSPM